MRADAAEGDNARYRVSGLLITDDKQIAFIEKSDGSQSLYRRGDSLEGFTISAIEAGGVRLSGASGDVFLPLRGEPTDLSDVKALVRTRDLEVSDGNTTAALDYEAAWRDVRGLQAEIARLAESTETGPAREKRRADIERRFNKALGLPAETVVRAIDRDRIGSVEQALLVIGQSLQNKRTIRLEVDGVPGIQVIYTTHDGA